MRITHKHNLKNYLSNRRIAVIQKGERRNHTKIQFINNRLVDKYISNYNNEYSDEVYDPYDEKNIAMEIHAVNRVATTKELLRILKHSLVTRNPQTELEAHKVISSVNESLTSIEAKRVVNNLNYVDNVLANADVDINKYNALVEKLPYQTSRKEVLYKCIKGGEDLPPSKRQAWLEKNLRRGASYNMEYSYKELNQLSRDLERYKTNRLDYETAIMENKQADREGYENPNQTKTWIWSTLDRTRHEGMDGETVGLTEKFEVVNEVNGDVDYLRFPNDIEFDHNNCSNICNCQCSYEINQA